MNPDNQMGSWLGICLGIEDESVDFGMHEDSYYQMSLERGGVEPAVSHGSGRKIGLRNRFYEAMGFHYGLESDKYEYWKDV